MIGKSPGLGTGFAGLQQYLLHGRNGAAPDRSVWTATRNLPDPDPEKAAGVMRSTATASTRTEKPVYHLSVSLAPGEHLERRELERVADRLLADLGLGEHQALIAEHADGAQQHIHLMVNRVHPDTGRAWRASHDYPRIERSLRAQEQELGLTIVPGRHAPVPGRERFVGARLGKGEFAGRVRELVGEGLREGKSWQEVHASMTPHGLTLQPSRSGRGLVVTDGRQYVAASKVGREASRPRLEARLGRFEAASPDLKKLQEVSRTLRQRGRLEHMRSRLFGARRELNYAQDNHEKAAKRLDRASKELDRALGKAYRDPAAVRGRIDVTIERSSGYDAAESIRERPGAAGKLRGRMGSRPRAEAREAARGEVSRSIRNYSAQRQSLENAHNRLRSFRRNPKQPLLEAVNRAHKVLGGALRRLERLDQEYTSRRQLGSQAAALVQRLGWQAVGRLIPGPGYQVLRVAVSLAKAPARVLDQGLGRSR